LSVTMPFSDTPSRAICSLMKRPILLVADAGDEARFQAKARSANGDIRRAAPYRFGERGDILEPCADLLPVEIDEDRPMVMNIQFGHGFARGGRLSLCLTP